MLLDHKKTLQSTTQVPGFDAIGLPVDRFHSAFYSKFIPIPGFSALAVFLNLTYSPNHSDIISWLPKRAKLVSHLIVSVMMAALWSLLNLMLSVFLPFLNVMMNSLLGWLA